MKRLCQDSGLTHFLEDGATLKSKLSEIKLPLHQRSVNIPIFASSKYPNRIFKNPVYGEPTTF